MNYRLLAPVATEPVTVTELARNLRLLLAPDRDYDGAETALLSGLISAAREDVEAYTQRNYAEKTLISTFRAFESRLNLASTLLAVQSITYLDTDEIEQTISPTDYLATSVNGKGIIEFRASFDYPTLASHPEALKVTYTVGYDDIGLIPQTIKQAIILVASHWYENREAANMTGGGIEVKEIPLSYRWLLDAHRLPALG